MSEAARRPAADPSVSRDDPADATLRASERMLAEAQRVAQIGSWSWDIQGGTVTWSDEMYRVYGLEPGSVEVDLDAFLERVHSEDRAMVREVVQRGMESGADFDFQHRLVRPDGEVRFCHGRGAVIQDAHGQAVRMVGTGQDITEQLRAREREQELRLEHERRAAAEAAMRRLRFLAEAGDILASSLDYETTLSNVAELAVPRIADWCAVDVLDEEGRVQRLAVAHEDPAQVALVRELEQRWPSSPDAPHGAPHVVRSGEPEWVEEIPDELLVNVARDEEHLELLRKLGLRSYICAPLRARGRTLGALTVVHAESGRRYGEDDLRLIMELAQRAATAMDNARLVGEIEEERAHSEEQAVELEAQTVEMQELMMELEVTAEQLHLRNEELEATTAEAEHARAAAEEANEAKSQFLAAMSHELRTPLNAIAGYAELLELGIHGPMNQKQLETLKRIQRNEMRLLGLINDVLNFAKLEASRVRFDIGAAPLNGLLGSLDQLIGPQVDSKGLTYEYRACAGDLAVLVDREKLEQVLLNLLSNAIKFTPAGGSIVLSASREEGEVRIRVADTGRGIPPDRLEHIFEPFVQVDPHLTREAEGVGLGLSISRDLMHGMGGDITVESSGSGSVFTVHALPVPDGH